MTLAALALAVSAPSFDCEKASTKVERMICADPALTAGDRAIANLYAGVPPSNSRARREHKDWLLDRSKCQEKKCIHGSDRIRKYPRNRHYPACPRVFNSGPDKIRTCDLVLIRDAL